MRLLIAALTTAALAVAGCGSSYSSGGSSKTTGGGSSSSSAPSAYGGGGGGGASKSKPATATAKPSTGTIQVTLQNIAFNPSALHAKVGQTIKWTNRDSVAHNVTATKGEEFKSPTLNQGQSYSYKLDHPGTIHYVCTFHPNMTATVVVSR